MTEKERKLAVSILNQEIQNHRSNLEQLKALEATVTLRKGNYIPQVVVPYINLEKVTSDIDTFSIIISDLITVRDVLLRNELQATIQGTANHPGYMPGETFRSLKAAGLNWFGDDCSNRIWFY